MSSSHTLYCKHTKTGWSYKEHKGHEADTNPQVTLTFWISCFPMFTVVKRVYFGDLWHLMFLNNQAINGIMQDWFGSRATGLFFLELLEDVLLPIRKIKLKYFCIHHLSHFVISYWLVCSFPQKWSHHRAIMRKCMTQSASSAGWNMQWRIMVVKHLNFRVILSSCCATHQTLFLWSASHTVAFSVLLSQSTPHKLCSYY